MLINRKGSKKRLNIGFVFSEKKKLVVWAISSWSHMRTQGVISLICSCITAKYCPQYKYLICQPLPASNLSNLRRNVLCISGWVRKWDHFDVPCASWNEVDLHLKSKLYGFPKATKLDSLVLIDFSPSYKLLNWIKLPLSHLLTGIKVSRLRNQGKWSLTKLYFPLSELL